MLESYMLGIVTGFFIGVAVMAIPEVVGLVRKDKYIDITKKRR